MRTVGGFILFEAYSCQPQQITGKSNLPTIQADWLADGVSLREQILPPMGSERRWQLEALNHC
jgi:hypothetical protein